MTTNGYDHTSSLSQTEAPHPPAPPPLFGDQCKTGQLLPHSCPEIDRHSLKAVSASHTTLCRPGLVPLYQSIFLHRYREALEQLKYSPLHSDNYPHSASDETSVSSTGAYPKVGTLTWSILRIALLFAASYESYEYNKRGIMDFFMWAGLSVHQVPVLSALTLLQWPFSMKPPAS